MNFSFDPSRKLAVYQEVDPLILSQLARYVPEARQFNGSSIALPHTLRNAQTCRWLGLPVAPVMTDYAWPASPGIKPYESQKLAANFLVLHPKALNLSDLGSGKTLTCLWAADWLMSQSKEPFKALIVCPLSIMQRVWGDAIFKNFLSRRKFAILHGTSDQRLDGLDRDVDFYIVNFDGVGVGGRVRKYHLELDGFSAALAEREDIKLVIVDEASAYKDATTKRHRIARQIFQPRPYLWMLTGTPTPNAPTDAYGLAKMLNNAEGKSFKGFQLETMQQISQFKWAPKKDGYERARRLLQPSIRIDIKQVWDAPPMTTQQREVPLTDEQKKLLVELKKNFQIAVKSGAQITAVNEAAVRIKYLQIVMGAVYDSAHHAHPVDAAPRINELISVLEEAPGKVLIFAGLTSVLESIYKHTRNKWTTEVVNGATPQRERNRIYNDFQTRPEPRILVTDPQCTAHGLDLYMAQTVVFFGPTDKTELYLQAVKRAHRPGQLFPVVIVQIVATALEREIFRRIENNETLQGVMLDAVKRGEM